MTFRNCKVVCRDSEGIEHAVNVTGESLYDAVAQGLRFFRASEWVNPITVKVKEPEIEHRVRVRAFEAWLERTNRSPKEMAGKQRIRDRLRE